MLKMKKECEKCNAVLAQDAIAFICSYECTFCQSCSDTMNAVCPNCAGELLRRPARLRKPLEVAVSQIKSKLLGSRD